MAQIIYHASQEQFAPRELLRYVTLAQKAGFDAIHSSEHFQPWNERQGESGYALAWLGAAMQICQLPFGLVCTPGYRHHPAVLAQAIATLSQLAENRLWIALGSGEAINECITAQPWPSKPSRNERLLECFEIIRKLLEGQTVTRYGHVSVEKARLYSLPENRPMLLGAAITAETARWMGRWAEGLLTVGHTPDELAQVIRQFRCGGGEGKPIFVKVQLSYASTDPEAYQGAYEQWRTNVLDSQSLANLRNPADFESAAAYVQPSDLYRAVKISSDIQQQIGWLQDYLALGIDGLILHNVNTEQERFIEDFGTHAVSFLKC
ncbi:TIGR03885 family FMN-dependent LLM class oxidoreductase [Parapedobacter sp.]